MARVKTLSQSSPFLPTAIFPAILPQLLWICLSKAGAMLMDTYLARHVNFARSFQIPLASGMVARERRNTHPIRLIFEKLKCTSVLPGNLPFSLACSLRRVVVLSPCFWTPTALLLSPWLSFCRLAVVPSSCRCRRFRPLPVFITMPDTIPPLDPEAILPLANKGRGLYDDLLGRLQDPSGDPDLPGLDPNYRLKPCMSMYSYCSVEVVIYLKVTHTTEASYVLYTP
jgi:hypothetical protein